MVAKCLDDKRDNDDGDGNENGKKAIGLDRSICASGLD